MPSPLFVVDRTNRIGAAPSSVPTVRLFASPTLNDTWGELSRLLFDELCPS
ncbi:MAG TPA: hypothetical protein VMY88_06200 [Acidimicrobiales bacterium]|nr:hypothetical protein [Acidimicrobiales bacterium]